MINQEAGYHQCIISLIFKFARKVYILKSLENDTKRKRKKLIDRQYLASGKYHRNKTTPKEKKKKKKTRKGIELPSIQNTFST